MAFSPEEISQILEEFFKVVGTRQYIGARYVPIFGRKDEDSIEWDNTEPYEPLTIVLYQGNSYTSRQFVPIGVEITNQEFWALTGNYNAQVEQYRRETAIAQATADNALDETVRLESLINVRPLVFNTVADMQASTNLYDGAICHTNGFHQSGDCGGAWYVMGEGTPNGMDEIACGNLVASMIKTKAVCLAALGANASNDATAIVRYALESFDDVFGAPDTTYQISNTITISSGKKLHDVAFTVTGDMDGDVFHANDASDIEVTNVHVNYANANVNGSACMFFNNVSKVALTNCTIIGNKTKTGIYLHFAHNCSVIACTFHNTYFPVSIWGGEADPTKDQNRTYGSSNIVVRDCVSTSEYTSTSDMVYGSYWATNTDDCTFENNFVDGCYDVGVDLEFCINSKVIGNTIKNAYRGALGCLFGCIDCVYSNNIIKFELDTTQAPQLSQSTYRINTNNIIILCRNTNQNILFTGNVFVSQQSVGAANVWYPSTDSDGSTVTIEGNYFYNCYVRSAQKNVISILDNTFIADMVDVWFIEVRNAYKCRIAGNVATCNNENSTLLTSAFFLTSLAADEWHDDIDVVIRDNTLVKASIRMQAPVTAAHNIKIINNACPRIGLSPACFNGGAYVDSPYDCVVGYQDSVDNTYASLPTTTDLPANTMLPTWNPQLQNNQFMFFDGSAWSYKGAL